MSDQEDEHFEQVNAGASDSYPMNAGDLKQGGMIVIKERPCKIVELVFIKLGKHGHSKATLTAIDIFNGKKYEESFPSSHNIEVPYVNRSELKAISYDQDGYLSLMDSQGNLRQDVKLPDDTIDDEKLSKRIKNALDAGKDLSLTIMSSMNVEKVAEMNDKMLN